MPDISRRRLLQGAGTAAAAAFAAEFLPSNVRKALAAGPSRGGSIRDIKHVVILMQENRSFDHYFGTLPNVRGFSDPNAITLSSGQKVSYQPDTANPDGYLLPFHADTTTTSAQAIPSTSHAWNVQHESWDGGLMDGFVSSHNSFQGANVGPFTMSYMDRDDIPFHYALAENFTVCDGYHCSLLGPTWPNRLYLMSAWIDPAGVQGGPIISNQHNTPYGWKSYPEALTEAGVSWKVYQEADNYGCNVLEYFNSFQTAPVDSPLYKNGLRSLPGRPVRVGRAARPAADGLLADPDQLSVRAPGLHPGGGRGLRGQQDQRDRGQPGRVEQHRVHPQLRRERRAVRPRDAARPRRPARPVSSSPTRRSRRARTASPAPSAAASGCRA